MKLQMRLLATALLLASALPSGAGELLGKERVELTPFFGYRIGGHFHGVLDPVEYPFDGSKSYGGLADINLFKDNYKVELLWSHQDTGLARFVQNQTSPTALQVDHFQVGVMQEVGMEKARLAISALAGGTRFAAGDLGSDMRFSFSIGGVAKVFVNPHLGLRLDARAYGVFVKGVGEAFCLNGTCAFAYSGTMMWQGDFTGGLVFAF